MPQNVISEHIRNVEKLNSPDCIQICARFCRRDQHQCKFSIRYGKRKICIAGEEKIKRIAEILGQDKDGMLALAGKVSSDVLEIILQNPKEMATLLRRLNHASVACLRNLRIQVNIIRSIP